MRVWSLFCGRLGEIESGHRADSKTNVPRRTGESCGLTDIADTDYNKIL